MKSLRVVLFVLFGLSASFSIAAQMVDERDIKPCSQDAVERQNLITEAEAAEFNVRRIEIAGNTFTRHRTFVREMAFNEGDIFTNENLLKTIEGINRIDKIEPIAIDNVEIRLDRRHGDIDIVFCVTPREKVNMNNLFHLAFPVDDLDKARAFYGGVLECEEGRSSDCWIDFNLYGHQIVTHLAPESVGVKATNGVDADHVPVPHFGIVLPMDDWKTLAKKLESKGVQFIIEPKIRFAGEVGEQATMFFLDPSGNALEFKGFNDFSLVFAK